MNKVATKSKYTIFDGNLTLAWSELESQIKALLMFSVQQLLDLENLERKGAEKFWSGWKLISNLSAKHLFISSQ